MADREFNILIKATDSGAGAALDAVVGKARKSAEEIGKANAAASRSAPSKGFFKEAGEAGKSEGVAKIGDILNRTAGLEGAAGVGAKLLGASLIVDKVSESIHKSADRLRDLNNVIIEGDGNWRTIGGGIARAVPIIGEATIAFDDLGSAIKDIWKSRESIEKITADAAIIDKKIGDLTKRRQIVIDVIQNAKDAEDPIGKVNRERDTAIKETTDLRDRHEINPEQAAQRIAIARKEAQDKIADIRASIGGSLDTIDKATLDATKRVAVAGADSVGDAFKIKLADIDRGIVEKRAAIDKAIEAAKGEKGLSGDDRANKVAALGRQADAEAAAGAAERQRAIDDAHKQSAIDVTRITRESIQAEIDGGNEGLRIDAAQLDIAEKYRQKKEELAQALKNPDLTPVERAVIEHQQATLPQQQAAETDRATTDIRKAQRDDVNKITRESLQTEIELGNQSAKIAADKLDIATKYSARLDAINAKLKAGGLDDGERKQLEDAKAALAGQATAELARVGQSNVDASIRQGDRVAKAEDGRFTGESIAARSQVDVVDVSRATADNTKLIADAQGEQVRLLGVIAGKPTGVANDVVTRQNTAGGPPIGIVDVRQTIAPTSPAQPSTTPGAFGGTDASAALAASVRESTAATKETTAAVRELVQYFRTLPIV